MKKCLSTLLVSAALCLTSNAQLLITGAMDGVTSPGNEPKSIELFALTDIDFSATPFSITTSFNVESGGTSTKTFSFEGSIGAGEFFVITHDEERFGTVFGSGDYPARLVEQSAISSVANITGNDYLTLKQGETVVDEFQGNHEDGWAYRVSNTGPDAVYNEDNWMFGTFDENGLPIDGEGAPVFGTYLNISAVPEPEEYALFAGLGLVGFAIWHRRRKSAEA